MVVVLGGGGGGNGWGGYVRGYRFDNLRDCRGEGIGGEGGWLGVLLRQPKRLKR